MTTLPDTSATSPAPQPDSAPRRLTWIDLVLLAIVLGALVALIALGVDQQTAIGAVLGAGIVAAQLHRSFTHSS